MFSIPQLSYPLEALFPWAMLQSLWAFKAAGAWPWSSPEKLHGLCLEQFVASSRMWVFSLCEGWQEVNWESLPRKVRKCHKIPCDKGHSLTPQIRSPLLTFCTHQPFEASSLIPTSSEITFEEKDYEGKGRDWRFRKELTGCFEEYQV